MPSLMLNAHWRYLRFPGLAEKVPWRVCKARAGVPFSLRLSSRSSTIASVDASSRVPWPAVALGAISIPPGKTGVPPSNSPCAQRRDQQGTLQTGTINVRRIRSACHDRMDRSNSICQATRCRSHSNRECTAHNSFGRNSCTPRGADRHRGIRRTTVKGKAEQWVVMC